MKNMKRKSFPFNIEILLDINSIAVVTDDYLGKHELTVTLTNHNTLDKETQVLSASTKRVTFQDTIQNIPYKLELAFQDIIRKFVYKKYHQDLTFRGQTPLRIQGVGSGRCGTQSLANYLDGMIFQDGELVCSKHETLANTILLHIIQKQPNKMLDIVRSLFHNVEIAPYFWFVPESIIGEKVILLIRDGRKVVTSGMVRGWYTRESIWDKIKPDYPGTIFEKCCHLWSQSCETLLPYAHVITRLEDLQNSHEARQSLLKQLNIIYTDKLFPKKNVSQINPALFKWTSKEHEIFEKICGKHMDFFYPGWEKTTS